MIFKKRGDGYYAKRRQSLRKEIRKVQSETKWPNKRKSKRLSRLNNRYSKASQRWWDLRRGAQFEGAEFGLDITGVPYNSKMTLMYNLSSTPEEKEKINRQSIPGTAEYDSLRVLEDTSKTVTFFKTAVRREKDNVPVDVDIILHNGEPQWPTWMTEKELKRLKKEFEDNKK